LSFRAKREISCIQALTKLVLIQILPVITFCCYLRIQEISRFAQNDNEIQNLVWANNSKDLIG